MGLALMETTCDEKISITAEPKQPFEERPPLSSTAPDNPYRSMSCFYHPLKLTQKKCWRGHLKKKSLESLA